MHADAREEIEVPVEREKFGALAALFGALGFAVKVKWFRKRLSFRWDGIDVALDDTRGYGRILELEKVCGEAEREATIGELKARLASLGLAPTPKEEFGRRYADYLERWRELVREPA
jgi:adenylate cyclase class IV